MDIKTFRLGELFCGPGGLACGALKASVEGFKTEHASASDYDPDTCSTYRRNITPDNPESVICENVRNLDIPSLDSIDALTFGFSCNAYSVVGEQKGLDGTFGPLYTYGVKALKSIILVIESGLQERWCKRTIFFIDLKCCEDQSE